MTATAPQTATPVVPRPASTTLIVRDGAPGLEVLMVRRSLKASFMPGAYVFPGGAVDAIDDSPAHRAMCDESAESLARRIGAVTQVGDQALAFAVAALRECFEECGLWLGAPDDHAPTECDWAALRARLHAGEVLADLASVAGTRLATSRLHPWSRWVTPALNMSKRFDTLFFVVRAPVGQVPEVDAGETTTLAWVHPTAALAARERGEFPMEFATVRTVESLQPFAQAGTEALLAHAASHTLLPPIHPRPTFDADGRLTGVLIPGEPGYEEAAA